MIGWGIWGTGEVAHRVTADFALVAGAELRAVASRSEERAAAFARRHRIASSATGLEGLLANPAIDAIYVASPNARHAEDALAVIAAGKALLCEKPFALNAGAARSVIHAARQRRVFCMEAMWTRFIPAVRRARERVVDGALGPIHLLQGDFAYPVDRSRAPALFDRDAGGGALLDRGVYLVSLAQHLMGAPDRVDAQATIAPGGADEQGVYRLGYRGGALAVLTASLRVQGSNAFSVYGERGRLCLHDPFYRAHRVSVAPSAAPQGDGDGGDEAGWMRALRESAASLAWRRRLDPLVQRLRGRRVETLNYAGNGYQFELAEATECIAAGRGESAVMPLDDTLAVIETMDALRASFAAGAPAAP